MNEELLKDSIARFDDSCIKAILGNNSIEGIVVHCAKDKLPLAHPDVQQVIGILKERAGRIKRSIEHALGSSCKDTLDHLSANGDD